MIAPYKDREKGGENSRGEALVILNEPIAALDPLAEAEFYAGFERMVEEKTSIYIFHRMSSCRFCDDIIVMDWREESERGEYKKLLS